MEYDILEGLKKYEVNTGTGSAVYNYKLMKSDSRFKKKLDKALKMPGEGLNNFGEVLLIQDFFRSLAKVRFIHGIFTYVVVLKDGRIMTNTINDYMLIYTGKEPLSDFFIRCLEKVTIYNNVYDFLNSAELYGTLTTDHQHLQKIVGELGKMLNQQLPMPKPLNRSKEFYTGRNLYNKFLRNGSELQFFKSEEYANYAKAFMLAIDECIPTTYTGELFEALFYKHLYTMTGITFNGSTGFTPQANSTA